MQFDEDHQFRQLVQARMETAARRVAIAMCVKGDMASGVFDNGTVSFLRIDGNKLVVTNHHVWESFQDYRTENQECRLAIGGTGLAQPIDISNAVAVDKDQDLDICVLKIPSEHIEALGKEFCDVQFPPIRALEGDDVILCGFPGNRTEVFEMQTPMSKNDIVFAHELVLLHMHVESVSDRKILMRFREKKPEVQLFSKKPIKNYVWGGMSGSLVYRLNPESEKWVPCAIFHSSTSDGLEGYFCATHLDLINANGSLNRNCREE